MNWLSIKSFWQAVITDWLDDKASRLAAALAYYATLSLAPLLVIAIAIAGLVFSQEAAREVVTQELHNLIGQTGAETIGQMVESASASGSSGSALTLGFIFLLFAASGVFAQLQDALNAVWDVEPDADQGIMATIKNRFLSFTLVLGTGFLLLVSLLLSAAISAAQRFMEGQIPALTSVAPVANMVLSLILFTLLFAMIFKVLPDVEVPWKDVWLGAFFTAVLLQIGKYLLGLYLGRGALTSTYGAAGSVLVVLVWVYYAAQILFFGAEFTQVYARRHGRGLRPAEHAHRVD